MYSRRPYDLEYGEEDSIQFWGNYVVFWVLSGAFVIAVGIIFVSLSNEVLARNHLFEEYPFKEYECTINTTCVTSVDFPNITCAPEADFFYGWYLLRAQATLVTPHKESYTDWAIYSVHNSTGALDEAAAELTKLKTVTCYYSDMPESVKISNPEVKVLSFQPYVMRNESIMGWIGFSFIGLGVLIILISFPFKLYRASENGYPLMPCCDWHPKPIDVELVASCEINSRKKDPFILPGINSFWSNRYKQL